MKRLIAIALVANAVLLAGRVWQEMQVAAAGGAPVAVENGDINGDKAIDISDPIALLQYLFQGGDPPVAIAQQGGQLSEEQAEILSHMTIVEIPVDDDGNTAKTIRFTGVNVQVVNGLGVTNGEPGDPFEDPTTNGLGNLIVGYQELIGHSESPQGNQRTGSHNLVLGNLNNYTGIGGLVAGFANSISGVYSSVSGGQRNEATGFHTSVSGGFDNTASGDNASVSGGAHNTAPGQFSSVSGGAYNAASGRYASVSGGGGLVLEESGFVPHGNKAIGDFATVSGGRDVKVEEEAGVGP